MKTAVVVYDDADFQGTSMAITEDMNYIGDAMNDRISSLIIPGGWIARFYEVVNFTGNYITRTSNSPDVNFIGDLNNKISSVKLLKTDEYNEPFDVPGRCEWLSNVDNNREPATWVSNTEESCRTQDRESGGVYRWVKTAVVVYEDEDFQGTSMAITEDINYVGDAMNDRISSLVIPEGWVVRLYCQRQ